MVAHIIKTKENNAKVSKTAHNKATATAAAQGLYVLGELACKPQERLLKVVVALCRDVVVGKVLAAVEGDGLGLDLAVLNVGLVANQHDGHVLAHAHQVTVPHWHVLVCDTRREVEHDDGAVGLDAGQDERRGRGEKVVRIVTMCVTNWE